MRKLILLIIALLVGLLESASATHFNFVNGGARQNAEIRQVLDFAVTRLNKLLDTNIPDSIDIVTIETQQQFDSLAGGRIPEWGAGAAIPDRGLILLRQSMLNTYPGSTANLVQHELAHIALHHRVGGKRIPRFIDEGFASWFAGEWTFANVTTIAAAQLTHSLLPLRKIDEVNDFRLAKANLAYSQSYLVVFFIFQKFGELAFVDLLDALAKGMNTEDAFRSGLGVPLWSFEVEYRSFLSEKYTLLNILSDAMGLWVVLALVVIVGYIVLRRRRKDAIDRWKEEEKLASTDFDYTGSDDDEAWKDSEDSEDTSPRY